MTPPYIGPNGEDLTGIEWLRALLELILGVFAREVPPDIQVSPDEYRRQLCLAMLTALNSERIIEDAEGFTRDAARDATATRLRLMLDRASRHPAPYTTEATPETNKGSGPTSTGPTR